MKKKLFIFIILFLLIFLIQYPQETLTASREGMKLWLNTLMPTLLPFLILTQLLIRTNEIEKIFLPLKKIWSAVLGLSPSGTYALLLGLLCGYPMGAKITSDLYEHHKISKREAEYLLSCCNNASPTFLVTYVANICLNSKYPLSKIVGILFVSNIVVMLIFRFIVYHGKTFITLNEESDFSKKETSAVSSFGTLLDVSIMNGFETITRIGGYILLFSIISAVISHYWKSLPLLYLITIGTLELTTGLHTLSLFEMNSFTKYLLSMCMTSFGGICIYAQTKSILHKDISSIPYLAAKLLNTTFTGILILVFQFV